MYYSFCDYNILTPAVFSGADNYVKMFTDDPTFWQTIGVTFYFALVSVPLRLIFALIVALILLKTTKATGFYRAAYYLPSIIGGSVAVAVLWRRMWATDGVINHLLGAIGIETSFAWLGNTKTAIWMLIILAVWQFGSSMLVFLSSLKQIPASLYEAATRGWRQQVAAVLEGYASSADSHHFLQPGYADDQRIPGIHTVLHHYPGTSDELHSVLHRIHVSAVLRVL